MVLLIGNGRVLTFDEDRPVIEDGGVIINGEKIQAVGKTEELKKDYPGVELKDVDGKLIMPGMINTHMHLYSSFARGMDLKTDAPPRNFIEILEKLWWRLDNTLNEDDIYYSALSAILEGIRSGTTTIIDHHASYGFIDGSLDILARAIHKTGIRANLAFEISDRHGPRKSLAGLRENERFLEKLKGEENGYLGGLIGLHASFTLEDYTLKRASALSDKLDFPFHIHVAEGIADLEDSRKKGYGGVVKRLHDYQILRPGTLAIHGVQLQEGELEILKANNCYLIHNPESNMGNAVGAAPVREAFTKGITAGLGTDGYTADMFESIKVANLLQKHEEQDPRAGWDEVFRMVFDNNRKIASKLFKRELGILKPGAQADIIVVDYHPPTPLNETNYYSHLLFGVNGGMVETTIAGGRILMENQEVKILDYERVQERVREQARDFWQRF